VVLVFPEVDVDLGVEYEGVYVLPCCVEELLPVETGRVVFTVPWLLLLFELALLCGF